VEAATQTPAPPARLRQRYDAEIADAMIKRFGYSSRMQAPTLTKITLNMGVGDAKQSTPILEAATEQLGLIAGQRPNVRRARKSVAAFKLREEMPVGVAVTLRGARMWEFLDRLVTIAIPRIRDFRGLNPRSFDGRGNYSMGVREQLIFPEIDYDSVDQTRGLDVTITTTAKTDVEAFELLIALGFPFAQEGRPGVPAVAAEADAAPEAEAAAEAPAEDAPEADEPEAAEEASEPEAEDADEAPAADADTDSVQPDKETEEEG
jgi:large subunit ribosomal protein L5